MLVAERGKDLVELLAEKFNLSLGQTNKIEIMFTPELTALYVFYNAIVESPYQCKILEYDNDFALSLCRFLGIDKDITRTIRIIIPCEGLVMIMASMYATKPMLELDWESLNEKQ